MEAGVMVGVTVPRPVCGCGWLMDVKPWTTSDPEKELGVLLTPSVSDWNPEAEDWRGGCTPAGGATPKDWPPIVGNEAAPRVS